MAAQEEPQLNRAQLADLSALADGTVDPRRRHAVEAWIARSPEARRVYDRERRAVELLHSARVERAPSGLRARVNAQRARQKPSRSRRVWLEGGIAGTVGAVALLAAFALIGGTSASPSVAQAAQLALRGPSLAAPAPDPTAPRTKLAPRLQDVYFPNWSTTLRWRPIGQRQDRLAGRPALTVYYQRGSNVVAYTIVGAPALSEPAARVTRLDGFELRTLSAAGRTVVTWRRAGHTCVLSGSRTPRAALQRLAAWRAPGLSG